MGEDRLMAIKYLAGERLIGTAAERTGYSTSLSSATNLYPDSIGNVATLKVVGATSVSSPTAPSGLGSNSINFDGTDDYCDGYGLRQAMDTQGSISFWFNADADEDAILMGFAESGANTKFEVTTRGSRKLGAQIKIDGTAKWEVTADTEYNTYGNWNHVVITLNGTTPKIYINGTESTYTWSTDTDKTVWWTALRSAGADSIAIGCKPRLNGASRTEFYNGQITDIAFWDEDLPIGANSSAAGSIKYLYDDGDGRLASTISTDQTAHFPCQAIEDGIFELGDLSWNNSAPTYEGDNNNNGTLVNQDVSYIRGLRAKGAILYLKKVGTMTGSATVGVWSGANSGNGKNLVGSAGTITAAESNALSSSTHSAVTKYFTERTLLTNDSISLQCNTSDGFSSSNNLSWQYIDSGNVWDGNNTIRNRYTPANGYWSPTNSDMRMAIITESDALVSHGGTGNTNTYAYPNLPNGTIFEESDTGKIWMFDGSQTWNEMT